VSSPVSALLSWLLMGALAVFIGFAALAWPDDAVWFEFEEALLAMSADPANRTPTRQTAATAGVDGVGATDGDAGTGGDTAGDDEPLDSPVPVDEVPEVPDLESLVDELPAEGNAPRRRTGRIEVGDTKIEVVDRDDEWVIHEVAPTETPEQIAHRYGIRPESLRMWNGIKPETVKLKVGTRLKLHPRKVPPARRKHEYWVQPGDTWWSIGTTFGIDSRDLRATNASTPQRLVAGISIDIWVDPIVYMWVSGDTDAHVPLDVRLGAVGIGPPQAGRLVNGVQLPPHEAYALKLPPSAYGTTHAVAHVVKAMDEFHRRSEYRAPLMMGSMSAKHGGPLSGHRSHQTGRDLDIRLPLREALQQHIPVTAKRVDWVALWHLIDAFDTTGQVVVIFLDYAMQEHLHAAAKSIGASEQRLDDLIQFPHGNKANLGLVRHSSGHEAHIHVRVSCGPSEPECVSEADFDGDAD